MKKIILFCLFSVLITETISAQTRTRRSVSSLNRRRTTAVAEFQLSQGQNLVNVPQGKVTFLVDGSGNVSQAKFIDKMGKAVLLVPSTPAETKLSQTGCKNALPETYFIAHDKSVGIGICRPGNGSGGAKIAYFVEELVE